MPVKGTASPELHGQLELVRPPAPGALELVRAFLNTRNLEHGTDLLETPAGLTGWLRDQGLIDRKTKATELDAAQALAVREALRALGAGNNGIPAHCDVRVLEDAAGRGRLTLAFDPGGPAVLRPGALGVDAAIGVILAAVHRAMYDGSWARLKVCADEGCAWAYYDSSKNGCSRWCSADTCGNRNKVKRYRERRALEAAPEELP